MYHESFMYKNFVSLEIFHPNKLLFNKEIKEQKQARYWFQPIEEMAQLKDLSLSKSSSHQLMGKELPYQDPVIP